MDNPFKPVTSSLIKAKKNKCSRLWSKAHPIERRLGLRKRYYRGQQLLDALKNKPCFDCAGWFEPCQMDFDHRDPENKSFSIGYCKRKAIKTLLIEIAKCDVVCANCHRLRTKRRGFWNQLNLSQSKVR